MSEPIIFTNPELDRIITEWSGQPHKTLRELADRCYRAGLSAGALTEADAYAWAGQCLKGIEIESHKGQQLADRIASAVLEAQRKVLADRTEYRDAIEALRSLSYAAGEVHRGYAAWRSWEDGIRGMGDNITIENKAKFHSRTCWLRVEKALEQAEPVLERAYAEKGGGA